MGRVEVVVLIHDIGHIRPEGLKGLIQYEVIVGLSLSFETLQFLNSLVDSINSNIIFVYNLLELLYIQ